MGPNPKTPMKKRNNSVRASSLQITLAIALTSISAILFASSVTLPTGGSSANGPQPDRPRPDVVAMVGPVLQNLDLRMLPYVPPTPKEEERRLTRHPFPLSTLQP